jgi:hypothetical protein
MADAAFEDHNAPEAVNAARKANALARGHLANYSGPYYLEKEAAAGRNPYYNRPYSCAARFGKIAKTTGILRSELPLKSSPYSPCVYRRSHYHWDNYLPSPVGCILKLPYGHLVGAAFSQKFGASKDAMH